MKIVFVCLLIIAPSLQSENEASKIHSWNPSNIHLKIVVSIGWLDDESNLYMGNGCFNHHFHPLSASSIRDPNWSPKWRSRFQPWKKSRIKPPKGSRTEEPGLKWLFRLPSLPGWWFQPIWKIWVKMGIFPKVLGENKKYLSCQPPR